VGDFLGFVAVVIPRYGHERVLLDRQTGTS
jgi:hypothetical protein